MGPRYQGPHGAAMPDGRRLNLPLRLEGLVDHLLEALQGTVRDPLAVDEEGGRALHVRGPPVPMSFSICCWTSGALKSFSQRATSRPICPAYSFSLSKPISRLFLKTMSCISQNFPCLPAAPTALAAGIALGCMVAGRGNCL